MNGNTEFILEFVVHHITCKNVSVRSSPLAVTLPGCPDIIFNAKSSTVCKIAYNKGKRVSFSHYHLINLNSSFVLIQGHGDPTIRATCSFDFYELLQNNSDGTVPTVVNLEVGMDSPDGERFGVLFLSFQIYPASELVEIQSKAQSKLSTRGSKATTPRAITSQSRDTKRISVKPTTPRSSTSVKNGNLVPELQIPSQLSSRSAISSIHERYMKRNELWIGHHCSTHADEVRPRRYSSSKISTHSSSREYQYS